MLCRFTLIWDDPSGRDRQRRRLHHLSHSLNDSLYLTLTKRLSVRLLSTSAQHPNNVVPGLVDKLIDAGLSLRRKFFYAAADLPVCLFPALLQLCTPTIKVDLTLSLHVLTQKVDLESLYPVFKYQYSILTNVKNQKYKEERGEKDSSHKRVLKG